MQIREMGGLYVMLGGGVSTRSREIVVAVEKWGHFEHIWAGCYDRLVGGSVRARLGWEVGPDGGGRLYAQPEITGDPYEITGDRDGSGPLGTSGKVKVQP